MWKRRWACACFVTPLAICIAAFTGCGNEPATEAAGATEAPATLTLSEEVRLGQVDGLGTISDQNSVTLTPDGRYLVVSNFEPGIIKVFGPDGRYVNTIGRRGHGPGEFQTPGIIHADAGRLTIFDWGALRATRLGSGLEPLQTHQLPVRPQSIAPLDGDRYVLAAEMRGVAVPFHVFDWASGTVSAVIRPDTTGPLHGSRNLLVARADGNSFWAVTTDHYRLERLDARTGEVLQVVTRDVEWFPPGQRFGGLDREVPPVTRITDMASDDDGLLWVVLATASSEWRPLPPARVMGTETYTSDAQMQLLYDTVVEVLDPQTGNAIVSERFPGRMTRLLGAGRAWRYDEDDVGNPTLVVYRLDLRR
jgi:hypothetical protein